MVVEIIKEEEEEEVNKAKGFTIDFLYYFRYKGFFIFSKR